MQKSRDNRKNITIVIPCYNEEESLPQLFKELRQVHQTLKVDCQTSVILVNDGSSDRTQTLIEQFAKTHSYLFYIEFASNSGHQAALRAGIEAAEDSDVVIMMDADLQHPPKYISKMLELWQKRRANIIQMIREDSLSEAGTFKFITSRLYYWLMNKISDLNLEYGASDFRLIDQAVIRAVIDSPEKDLFLRGYFSWLNVSRVTLGYKPNKRIAGQSKYTFKKMLQLAGKGVLQFSEKPLRLAVNIGIVTALFSITWGVILIIRYLLGGYAVSGWTSLSVVILFCFGINFILVGLIGVYLSHSITISKQRPEYIIASQKLPRP